MTVTEQKNIGSGNTNTVNSNNILTFTININGNTECVGLSDLFKAIGKNFKEIDKEINESLPQKVLVNKTNYNEAYQTNKIITSLLQLGIPIEATYEIAQATVNRIKEFILTNKDETVQLTTKDIRKMVSVSIQEMDIERFSYSNIENWNNLYIRRYGHNNKRVEIYYSDSDRIDSISYDYINSKLLKDIIYEITKGKIRYETISSRYRNDIATEILAFINRCDLYRINYDVLKSIIKEIAVQPPHPWFINNETRKEIMHYDAECLDTNIVKLEYSLDNNLDCSQSVKIEILHHASALILEKYNYFLGCYDLSSFFLLKDLLNNVVNKEKWDLAISFSKLSHLLSDFSYSYIDIMDYIETVNQINDAIKNHSISNSEFDKILLKFAKMCKQLFELSHNDGVVDFLNSDWSSQQLENVIKNLKLIFYSVFPVKTWNLSSLGYLFWLNYKTISLESYSEVKPQILVVYNDGKLNNYDFLKKLKDAKTRNVCNTIVVVGSNQEFASQTYNTINNYLTANNLEQVYISFIFGQDEITSLFKARNKVKTFDKIIEKQLEM